MIKRNKKKLTNWKKQLLEIEKRDLERDLFLASLIAINYLISYSYYKRYNKKLSTVSELIDKTLKKH